MSDFKTVYHIQLCLFRFREGIQRVKVILNPQLYSTLLRKISRYFLTYIQAQPQPSYLIVTVTLETTQQNFQNSPWLAGSLYIQLYIATKFPQPYRVNSHAQLHSLLHSTTIASQLYKLWNRLPGYMHNQWNFLLNLASQLQLVFQLPLQLYSLQLATIASY